MECYVEDGNMNSEGEMSPMHSAEEARVIEIAVRTAVLTVVKVINDFNNIRLQDYQRKVAEMDRENAQLKAEVSKAEKELTFLCQLVGFHGSNEGSVRRTSDTGNITQVSGNDLETSCVEDRSENEAATANQSSVQSKSHSTDIQMQCLSEETAVQDHFDSATGSLNQKGQVFVLSEYSENHTDFIAEKDFPVVKKEPVNTDTVCIKLEVKEENVCTDQDGSSPSCVLEREPLENSSSIHHRDERCEDLENSQHYKEKIHAADREKQKAYLEKDRHRNSSFGSEDARSHFIQPDGELCSLSSFKKRLMDRERQRRHRERIRADPEKQQAYREKERLRYQHRKNMDDALPGQIPAESHSHGLSITEYQTGSTMEDRSHPGNYVFPDVSQNLDTVTRSVAHLDKMVVNRPTTEPEVVNVRQQIEEMTPASRPSNVTEKETQQYLFSTQHRGAVFGSQDVNCYVVQQSGELCSLSRLKKRSAECERMQSYRERIRSDPLKQSDDEKERRRLLNRERQRRCRQRLQADPVRWQAYLERERRRSREAARRKRAERSLAKAPTGWISEWGQDGL